MDIKPEDIVKGIVTFVVGVATANAGKILDWLRGAPKDKVDLTKAGVDMLLDIIDREKNYSKQVTENNDSLVKKNHDLVNENYEKGKMILRLTNELEKCEHDRKKTLPTDDRDRGRRSEGIP